MPKLDMDGPFDLTNAVIDKEVGAAVIGNFALGHLNKNGKFVVKVVGRSDNDLNRELKSARRRFSAGLFAKMLGRGGIDKFKFSIADTALSAYQVEQRAFDSFGGLRKLLDRRTPAPPG